MRLFCHLSISSIHRKAGPDPNNEAELRPQRKDGPFVTTSYADPLLSPSGSLSSWSESTKVSFLNRDFSDKYYRDAVISL